MSGDRIETHFADGNDFEDVLDAAIVNAASTFQLDFTHDWKTKWDSFGLRAFMTKKQADTLRAIAGMEPDD